MAYRRKSNRTRSSKRKSNRRRRIKSYSVSRGGIRI